MRGKESKLIPSNTLEYNTVEHRGNKESKSRNLVTLERSADHAFTPAVPIGQLPPTLLDGAAIAINSQAIPVSLSLK